jgi:hypothetical protein
MIRHEPNRKHGADTTRSICTEVNDNGTVQLRVPTPRSRVPDLEYPKYTPL